MISKVQFDEIKEDIGYIQQSCEKAKFENKEFIEVKVSDLSRTIVQLADLVEHVVRLLVKD
jgi:hypothetical protein